MGELSEKAIENSILFYLARREIFAWKVKSVGTFDPKIGKFRKSSNLYMKGVSDILGIYKGKPLAIEVKSKKGVLSDEQKTFLIKFKINGGIAIVARSIEDVEDSLLVVDRDKDCLIF